MNFHWLYFGPDLAKSILVWISEKPVKTLKPKDGEYGNAPQVCRWTSTDFVPVQGLNYVVFPHDGTHISRTDCQLMASQIRLVKQVYFQ